jgi:dihydropteroate synthase
MAWRASAQRVVALEPFALMGVLNATPDSFSDGGLHLDAGVARERALAMIEEGATIIDVGGESTRPGAARINADEQRRRIEPVIRAVRGADARVAITIDTTLAAVAAAALDCGADAVNDVSAGLEDEAMLPLIARRECGVVLMHRVLPPERDRFSHEHSAPLLQGDVVGAVGAWLLARANSALEFGVAREAIALDPGLGFGKTVEQNWELIARSGDLADFGFPVIIGASRKSFVGKVSGVVEPSGRVVGSVVAAVIAWSGGARIIRTHDVAATREGLMVAAAARRGSAAKGPPSGGDQD